MLVHPNMILLSSFTLPHVLYDMLYDTKRGWAIYLGELSLMKIIWAVTWFLFKIKSLQLWFKRAVSLYLLCISYSLLFWNTLELFYNPTINPGYTLLENVCLRLTWHMWWIWRYFYACLWQLSLSVICSFMSFLMQRYIVWDVFVMG